MTKIGSVWIRNNAVSMERLSPLEANKGRAMIRAYMINSKMVVEVSNYFRSRYESFHVFSCAWELYFVEPTTSMSGTQDNTTCVGKVNYVNKFAIRSFQQAFINIYIWASLWPNQNPSGDIDKNSANIFKAHLIILRSLIMWNIQNMPMWERNKLLLVSHLEMTDIFYTNIVSFP